MNKLQLSNDELKKWFEGLLLECNPENPFHLIFDSFFGGSGKPKINFIGGINDTRNTLHENLFSALYPHYKKQVHFGTGKGGYEKYLSKRYTADFYDEENDIIYEIDGTSHDNELQKIKDKIRDYFFWHELGIKTIRLTNKAVENIAWERLCALNEEGKMSERT
ncbi:DUF559 domain-containing protein [Staphylococcus haemolyticus]|uniref:DUF559 domain-containing protein n=1 Tax=Staphylococcus haemolyticus TaxID=1283 RepID=UPI002AD42CC6|nr:DUF559 domain-containing protein [Staphylococcus haemolyticus]